MGILDILVYISILIPFALLIAWQIKRPWIGNRKVTRHLKKRVGLPIAIVNPPDVTRKKALNRFLVRVRQYILQAGIAEEKVNMVLICGPAVAGLSILLLMLPFKFGPAVRFGIILLPFIAPFFIIINNARRRRLLMRQLPDAIEAIIRSLSSGSNINQAILAVGNDFPDPISGEFNLISNQIKLGVPFREVMNGFKKRLNISEVHYLATALIVHRETGGQLIKILEELAGIMHRRVAFRNKVKALTAESRFTAVILGSLPFVFMVFRYFIDPDSINFFLYDPIGQVLFMACLALIITGFILLRYMTRINF